MKWEQRVALVLVCNGVLNLVVQVVNGWLGRWSLHLMVDVLLVLFPVLYLRFGQALLVLVVSALMLDAMRPVPFGVSLLVFVALFAILIPLRPRLRREKGTHVNLLAALVHTCIFALMAAQFLPSASDLPSWGVLAVSYGVSTLCVVWLAHPWCEAQRVLFRHLGVDLAAELRRL